MGMKTTRSGLFAPEFVLPAGAFSARAVRGSKLVNLRSLGIIPGIAGGSQMSDERNGGYNAAADLVTKTSDGFDLNDLWNEYQETVAEINRERQTLIDFLTFTVNSSIERVPQVSGADFEKASEYGEPKGIRPGAGVFKLGFDFEWYDIAARYTWKFLADAPRNQVDSIHQMVLEADNRNIFTEVMRTLFRNTNRKADIDGELDVDVFALYNGDGTVPPKYKSYTFAGNHTHYVTSGAATIDSGDLDLIADDLTSHGYSKQNGMTLVVLANRNEVKVIRQFRMASGDQYDFIPAQGSAGTLMPANTELLGGQPASTFQGLTVAGSYGDLLIIEEDAMPVGYIAGIATGGRANLSNPVGLREHPQQSLRGLRLVKGPNPDYPLVESFYQRGFGTGIRHRGGAFVMQISAAASYTPPAIFS